MKVYVGDIVVWRESHPGHKCYGKVIELNFLTQMLAVRELGSNQVAALAMSFVLNVYRHKRNSKALTI